MVFTMEWRTGEHSGVNYRRINYGERESSIEYRYTFLRSRCSGWLPPARGTCVPGFY